MKKRTCHHYCTTCRLSFEDRKRYDIHVTSRRHVIEEELLSHNTARETLLVQDENEEIFLSTDGEDDDVFTEEDIDVIEVEENPGDNHMQSTTVEFFSPNEVSCQRILSQEFNISESENSEECEDENESDDDGADFYPFPSKIFFLLYCYVHNICRPKSRSDLDFLWLIFKELRIPVPTLNSVLNFNIEGVDNLINLKKDYADGYPFHWLPPSEILKLQLAVPSTAKSIQRFPEETDGPIREMYQGRKWRKDSFFHSPSLDINGERYFLGEIVNFTDNGSTKTGKLVRFFTKGNDNNQHVWVDLEMVKFEGLGYCILPNEPMEVLASSILERVAINPEQIAQINTTGVIRNALPQEKLEFLKVHNSKEKGNGKQVVVLPLVIFSDETSGNTTKKWNRLESYSMVMAGLPQKEANKFENIHLLTASNIVSSTSLGQAISKDLKELEEGEIMYDALTEQDVLVQCPVLCVTADNPRASEFEHHLGNSAKRYCRKCNATSDNGTHLQTLRTNAFVKESLQQLQQCQNENQRKKVRKTTGVTEKGGAFDCLSSFCGYTTTPVEILHTVLLGPVKYLLGATIKSMTPENKQKMNAKVVSLDMTAFSRHIKGNITRNHGSYVGRDFKLWMQVAVFVLEGLIPDDSLTVWSLLGEIFIMAYTTAYVPGHTQQFYELLETFTRAVQTTHPILLKKPKMHLLHHLPQDMVDLGSATGFSTERFEAFNAIVRGLNVNSNRHATSLDITKASATMEKLRFVLKGGVWHRNNKRHQASRNLTDLSNNPKIQRFINNIPASTVERIWNHQECH